VIQVPESRAYRLKRLLLGEPIVTERLSVERLSTPLAVGVLSPDMISSSAYGTEEMLVVLVPAVGLAAFNLVLPLTIGIVAIAAIVTLSYREVVSVYTKAGGSYVVARENFGLNVAQFAAVALLIDYILTVAVQTAAGTDALTSAFPSLISGHNGEWVTVAICVAVVTLLIWGNLRGIREAGRSFAFPTYFYVVMVGFVVVVGLVKAALGDLPVYPHPAGALPLGHRGGGLLEGASVFIMLRAFANGGSSLTGMEAISNSVSALEPPEGVRARHVQVITSTILAALVLGVSLLAHFTHAIPYGSGSPTVISQVAKASLGHAAFYIVQLATLLILYTGGNTSFNGFPFLVSFVAADGYLPRAFSRRGHRLTYSTGIVVLGAVAIVLLLITRARVSDLVSLYAIGVFTGFTMAGAGMVKHHLRFRESGWRYKCWINGAAAVVSAVVVLIFAVTKFTEGAWAVVVVFPILMWVLIRTNRRYRAENEILGGGAAERAVEARPLRSHTVFVLVDNLDLATARAVQYARSLSPSDLRAIHFVIDSGRARALEQRWVHLGMKNLPLELIDCPDRRIARAAAELAAEEAQGGDTEVSILLPRRAYGRLWRRLLHDQTADRIAAAVSQVPHVTATIVPFDVEAALQRRRARPPKTQAEAPPADGGVAARAGGAITSADSVQAADAVPISCLQARQRARVAGRVHSLTVKPWGDVPTLQVQMTDGKDRLTVVFLGRRQIPGMVTGARLAVDGTVQNLRGQLTMINPDYEFLAPAPAEG
jgi:amino acid transporter